MKTKNLALAAAAFTVAVGSAFASFLSPAPVFVHAQFGGPGSTIECINTGVECEVTGTVNCTVVVDLSGGGSQTAESNSTSARTYQATCATILKNSVATPIQSPISGSNRPTRLTL
jgi:hypothetical protein